MPVYEYKAVDKGCPYCEKGFDQMQKMGSKALTVCPRCGAPVRKMVSLVSFHKDVLSLSNLREKGFTKLVRKDKGVYERET